LADPDNLPPDSFPGCSNGKDFLKRAFAGSPACQGRHFADHSGHQDASGTNLVTELPQI
jgi:hypothetical protein